MVRAQIDESKIGRVRERPLAKTEMFEVHPSWGSGRRAQTGRRARRHERQGSSGRRLEIRSASRSSTLPHAGQRFIAPPNRPCPANTSGRQRQPSQPSAVTPEPVVRIAGVNLRAGREAGSRCRGLRIPSIAGGRESAGRESSQHEGNAGSRSAACANLAQGRIAWVTRSMSEFSRE